MTTVSDGIQENPGPDRPPTAGSSRLVKTAPLLLLGLLTLGLLLFHIWYIWARRRGFPLSVDESGYIANSVRDLQLLQIDGLKGIIRAIAEQPLQAPLVPLVTVPIISALKAPLPSAFATILGFYVLLVWCTYGLARRFLPAWWSLLAAALVAASPEALGHARSYTFGVPAAALFVAAAYCLLRSEAFDRVRWAFAGAILLGFAALSRTMMVAFVPGLIFAVAVNAAVRGITRRRLLAFAASSVIATAVMLTWYASTFPLVYDYLARRRFRPPDTIRAPAYLEPGSLLVSLQIPLTVALIAVVVAALWARRAPVGRSAMHRTVSRSSDRRGWRTTLADERSVFWISLAWILLVLAFSDEALGQWLPAVPFVTILVLGPLARLQKPIRRILVAMLIAALAIDIAVSSSFFPQLTRLTSVTYKQRSVPLIDGRLQLQIGLDLVGLPSGPAGHLPHNFRKWPRFNKGLTYWLQAYAEQKDEAPTVFFATYDPLLNVNELRLWDTLSAHQPAMATGVVRGRDPIEGEGVPYNFLILMDIPPRPLFAYETSRSLSRLYHRAIDARFEKIRTGTMPDGRAYAVFWRSMKGAEPA